MDFWGQGDNKNKLPDNETAIEKSHLIYRAVMSTAQRVGSLSWHIRKNDKIKRKCRKRFLEMLILILLLKKSLRRP